ncbi:lysylphosphatidylglycerol synthase domain-containing protein [Actinokineospora guangxiensis]|uniref:Lysylphosphatidylglycerol synthase domain-containing protein n=1 Tax=Actinokineospora guangxiensis TaxID=1490288 RepID=A0ABW0EGV8_9PSEU
MADRPRRVAQLAAAVFVAAACATAVWALRGEWARIGDAVGAMSWWRIGGALALAVAGLLATAEVWRSCLAALGSPVTGPAARRIFFPAQVGKYLPGAIWPFLAQVRLAASAGVPASRALVSGAMFLAVHAVTSVVAAATLLITQPGLADRYWWLGLAAPAALVLLHPRAIRFAARTASRSGRDVPELRWAHLGAPVGWMALAWVLYGGSVWLLASSFDGSAGRIAAVGAGVFALGWLVGLVVVFAPAGLGAREAAVALVLTPLIGLAEAASVALVLRACHTAGDLCLAIRYGLFTIQRMKPPPGVVGSGYDAHASYPDGTDPAGTDPEREHRR